VPCGATKIPIGSSAVAGAGAYDSECGDCAAAGIDSSAIAINIQAEMDSIFIG
jgi:hypothetical protein